MLNHDFRPLKTNRVWYVASLFFLQSQGEKKTSPGETGWDVEHLEDRSSVGVDTTTVRGDTA